jgi:hypothetical protein
MSELITNIDQLQAAGLDLDENTNFEVLDPHLRDSERNFLIPVIGKAFYDAIIEDLDGETPTEAFVLLLPYLQKPVAFNGYYQFFKKPVGQLSHTGFYRNKLDYADHAPKWEFDQLKADLICKADRAMDELISYLNENQGDFELWENGEYRRVNKNLIIPSAEIFNSFINIACSGRVFQRLLHFRQSAERNIPRVICKPLYDRIILEISGEEVMSQAVNDLIPYLQRLVAYDAMVKGVLMLPFTYAEGGIYIYSYMDGTLSKTGINAREATMLSQQWRELYEDARNELLGYLKDNLEDFPEYENSPCYTDAVKTLVPRYDNDPYNKHFGI